MVLALVVTLAGAFWIVLYLSYRHGGINLNSWFWLTSSSVPPLLYLDDDAQSLDDGARRLAVYGLWRGADVAADLGASAGHVVAHSSAGPWAMTGTVFTSGVMWFNVFLAWAIKGLVLKYGGGVFVPSDPVLFCRHDLGCLCRGRHLAGH